MSRNHSYDPSTRRPVPAPDRCGRARADAGRRPGRHRRRGRPAGYARTTRAEHLAEKAEVCTNTAAGYAGAFAWAWQPARGRHGRRRPACVGDAVDDVGEAVDDAEEAVEGSVVRAVLTELVTPIR